MQMLCEKCSRIRIQSNTFPRFELRIFLQNLREYDNPFLTMIFISRQIFIFGMSSCKNFMSHLVPSKTLTITSRFVLLRPEVEIPQNTRVDGWVRDRCFKENYSRSFLPLKLLGRCHGVNWLKWHKSTISWSLLTCNWHVIVVNWLSPPSKPSDLRSVLRQ